MVKKTCYRDLFVLLLYRRARGTVPGQVASRGHGTMLILYSL